MTARGLGVFAVEDRSAQLTWSSLGPGTARFSWDGGSASCEVDGGPGGVEVVGLQPDLSHTVRVRVEGPSGRPGLDAEVRVRTLPTPPGRELYRFATVSDLHFGQTTFGFFHEIREPDAVVAHPTRCARAALNAAVAWGAQRMVVKGDIVHRGFPQNWSEVAAVFGHPTIPTDMICGNHDTKAPRTVDAFAEAARYGLALHGEVTPIDVPGLRLVLMDSTSGEVDVGRWGHLRGEVAHAAKEADGPAMILVHHQPQSLPFPVYLPRGIPSPIATRFLREVHRANPDVIGSSGHTHRHRRRTISGVPWIEVGSTKDYPGVWAGYVVHEGGIRQVVRRILKPDVIAWTERTRRAALGTWGLWSPGTIDARCFVHQWQR